MNILLVNNDTAVAKLVRLCTQKTGDRLDMAGSIEALRDESYDLLILDSGLFSRDFLEQLNDKVIYAHSILITTREEGEAELFEKLLYKPFLPTELLVMLHQFSTTVEKEKEELSKEIVFEGLDDTLFSEEEILGDVDAAEQDALLRVQSFEAIEEAPLQEITPQEATEEEVLENIFSEQEVSEVKSILDALNSDEVGVEEEIVSEVVTGEEPLEEIDMELERALKQLTPEDLEKELDDGFLAGTERATVEETTWGSPTSTAQASRQNRESIETLKTLVQALENPQIARSLRGTITINLTFGED